MEYDRMNPTLEILIERLREYSKITYGAKAYDLSVAEAALLVSVYGNLMADLENRDPRYY